MKSLLVGRNGPERGISGTQENGRQIASSICFAVLTVAVLSRWSVNHGGTASCRCCIGGCVVKFFDVQLGVSP
jgi:hypothetical protein